MTVIAALLTALLFAAIIASISGSWYLILIPGNLYERRNAKMRKTEKTICIRLTVDEYRYAIALSKNVGKCKRPECGSVAHGLRWSLREHARREKINIFEAD